MAYVTADGCNLFLDFAGQGAPLLLLHGFSLDHRQWDPQWADLCASHETFRMDLRGHGRSGAPPRGYTYAGMARDLQRVLVQIGMDRLNPGWIVAHSLAADAALQAALAEPRALRGVVVVTPAVWGHAWSEEWRALWGAMREAARGGDVAAAMGQFAADALFGGVRDHADTFAAVRSMQSDCKGLHLVHGERDEGPDTLSRLAGCKVPLLVLSAERDRADFRDCAREIAAAVPGARTAEFATCGHFPNLEQPAAFTEKILEFVSQTSSA